MSDPSWRDPDPRLSSLLDDVPAQFEPRAGFRDELEVRLTARLPLGTGWGQWRRFAPSPASAVYRVAAPVLLLALLIATLVASPQARAQLLRVVCYVPDLGIETCDAQGLIAARISTAAHDGTTLTVAQLLSTESGATARLEVSGGADLGNALVTATVTLRDDHGRTYAPARRTGFALAPSVLGGGMVYHMEIPFPALAAGARAVTVTLTAPAPVGTMQVRVPLLPVSLAGLAVARPGGGAVTVRGVSVRVAAVLTNARTTDVQLVAQAPAALGAVVGLAGWGGNPGGVDRPLRPITLTDDHGRVYQELPAPAPPQLSGAATPAAYTDDVIFPPLPTDVRSARLTLPYVVVSQDLGQATVTVPIGHAGFDVPIPVHATLKFGPYSTQVTGAFINPNGCDSSQPAPACRPVLMVRLDLGGWQDGRKLITLQAIRIDGQPAGFNLSTANPTDGSQQWEAVGAPLPTSHGDRVSITLRAGLVAVAGPWQITVPIGTRSPPASPQ